MKKNSRWFGEMLVVGLVSLAVALLHNSCQPKPLEFFPENEPTVNDDELFSNQPQGYDEIFSDAYSQPERAGSGAKKTTSNSSAETQERDSGSNLEGNSISESGTNKRAEGSETSDPKGPKVTPKENSTSNQSSTENSTPNSNPTRPKLQNAEEITPVPSTTTNSDLAELNEGHVVNSGFKAITREQLEKAIGDDRFVILDARTEKDFAKNHVESAINIFPHMDDESQFMEKVLTLPRGKKYLLYCNGLLCDLAEELATTMTEFGFDNIYIYPQGWEGWQEWNKNKEND